MVKSCEIFMKNHRFVDVSIVRLSSLQVAYLAPEILLGQKYGHTAGAPGRGYIQSWLYLRLVQKNQPVYITIYIFSVIICVY